MFTPQQFKTAILVVISTAFFQATAAVAACSDCGRVASVNAVETEGKASGVGAVAGGVGGALIGNQFGKGGTKTALTVAGAAGGAYAGHQVEKSMSKKKTWQVAVNMDAGSKKTFNFESQPSFKTGDHVKVRDGKLLLLSD
jgi:outer membrane lipoprotein SlyB